jgi:hypothetical protein
MREQVFQLLFRFIKCIFILYFIYDMVSIVGKNYAKISQSLPHYQSEVVQYEYPYPNPYPNPNLFISNYTDAIKISRIL